MKGRARKLSKLTTVDLPVPLALSVIESPLLPTAPQVKVPYCVLHADVPVPVKMVVLPTLTDQFWLEPEERVDDWSKESLYFWPATLQLVGISEWRAKVGLEIPGVLLTS